jgi:5'-nucleotidase/UDP-sugar diphosphatase
MSEQNPFQIPSCFKLDIEQRRRERFKKTVVAAVIVSAALVVGLLIEGCVSEKSVAITPLPPENTAAAPAQTTQTAPAPLSQPSPSVSVSQNTLPLQPCPVAMVPKTATPVASQKTTGGTVYLVKSGDTLTRIAKVHGTTIAALKSANQLTSDRINVGEKLTIPSA